MLSTARIYKNSILHYIGIVIVVFVVLYDTILHRVVVYYYVHGLLIGPDGVDPSPSCKVLGTRLHGVKAFMAVMLRMV